MKTALVAMAVVSLAFASGCSSGAAPERPSTASPAGADQGPFMDPTTFEVALDVSQAVLDDVVMPITSGELALSSTGPDELSLDALEIEVGKVSLPQSTLEGMYLKDIRARVEKPSLARVQRSEAGTRFTTIETTLLVDWTLVTQLGDEVPLATLRFEGVKFDLGLYETANRQVADMTGGKQGPLGEWAGIGQLDNLIFDVHAVE